MAGFDELKKDLPVAMTMAAFIGISWYICVELNIRLFLTFRRRWGLYFWSCLLCSWGVMIQPLCMILADFGILRNLWVAFVLIYLSWWIMVVPQSLVLYSRLHLVMNDPRRLRWVLYMIIFTTIFISIPTMVLGTIAQGSQSPTIVPVNLIWDRIQVSIFFLQETLISLLYIFMTRSHLLSTSIFDHNDDKSVREVMRHLIYTNLLVVFLDISLLGMSYSPFFYVQAAYKPCVYGVKLRVEFAILNRLIASVQRSSHLSFSKGHSYSQRSGWKKSWRSAKPDDDVRLETFSRRGRRSDDHIIQGGTEHFLTSAISLEDDANGRYGIVQTTEISVVPSTIEKAAQPPGIGKS
ncbi:hypothetical protein K469DRAFT_716548 [Zopfia rhizophila CBS 207.26]|uniref:DUF7703 domain-containing protein n=1 Tax=Zopfia rhizophila CBS 207.26 TaxID=1314779 RepID=A0A6A6DMW5_9PEZI|nr:hypothetical protein K469DRAFT_716548 [Zopfia rhizophila CBS 207.26]